MRARASHCCRGGSLLPHACTTREGGCASVASPRRRVLDITSPGGSGSGRLPFRVGFARSLGSLSLHRTRGVLPNSRDFRAFSLTVMHGIVGRELASATVLVTKLFPRSALGRLRGCVCSTPALRAKPTEIRYCLAILCHCACSAMTHTLGLGRAFFRDN